MRTIICMNNAFDNIKHHHLCCYLLYWSDSCAPFFYSSLFTNIKHQHQPFLLLWTYIVGMHAFKAAQEGWLAFLGFLFTQNTRKCHACKRKWLMCALITVLPPADLLVSSLLPCLVARHSNSSGAQRHGMNTTSTSRMRAQKSIWSRKQYK